jgi:hypothetical protein
MGLLGMPDFNPPACVTTRDTRMRTIVALWIALGLQLALGLALAGIYSATPPAAAAPLRRIPAPSPCLAVGEATVQPRLLLLGETTAVTLALRVVCPVEPPIPLHVVLVIDGSGSVEAESRAGIKQAAGRLVDAIARNYPESRIGVAGADARARSPCPLTGELDQVKQCIDRAGAGGSAAGDAGIREGLRVIFAGRRAAADADAISEVMVWFSSGKYDRGCDPLLGAASQVKRQGIIMITACLGGDCDTPCLRAAASSSRYFFTDIDSLLRVFDRIRSDAARLGVRRVTIIDVLPPTVAYVPLSAEPEAVLSPAGDQLVWTVNFVPPDGLTVTLRLRPLHAGRHSVSLETVAEFIDNKNHTGSFTYPAITVTVLEPYPHATPTPAPKRWVAYLPVAVYLAPRADLP